jgi:hypothetical protein
MDYSCKDAGRSTDETSPYSGTPQDIFVRPEMVYYQAIDNPAF